MANPFEVAALASTSADKGEAPSSGNGEGKAKAEDSPRDAPFSWHLFISCERECASTDPPAADPWTPGVLAHLPTSRTVHTVQKKWWSSLKNVANPHFPLSTGPPPVRRIGTRADARDLSTRNAAPWPFPRLYQPHTGSTRPYPSPVGHRSKVNRTNCHIFPPSREPVGAVDGLRSRARSTRSADGCGPLRPSPGPPPGPYGRCDRLRARQA